MTPEERRTQVSDCLRRRKKRLKTIHLCQDCGMAPHAEGKTLCVGCLTDRRDRERTKRAQKKALDAAQ
jgi:ribosomal protein L37E